MKKAIILMVVAAVMGAAFAEANASATSAGGAKPKLNPRELFHRHNGGYLKRPGTQKGRLVIVNAQEAASVGLIEAFAEKQVKGLKVAIDVEPGVFEMPAPKIAGEASLFVVDLPGMPALLSAPESRWAMVNVAPLKKGRGEKQPFFEARLRKELARGFALLVGAQNSSFAGSILDCITDAEQLDKIPDESLPIDVGARFESYLSGYGVKPFELVTYRRAAKEGWAPAPTNDIQKAIFERVKADKERGPSKPLTIALPAKK